MTYQRLSVFLCAAMLVLLPLGAHAAVHSADSSENGRIELSELLRVIQLFNSEGYSCDAQSEDGYQPGQNGGTDCTPHDSDYLAPSWRIELSDLLRTIQFYNIGRYATAKAISEDGYAPVTDLELDPHLIPVIGDDDGNFLTQNEEEALGLTDYVDMGDTPIGVRLASAVYDALEALGEPNWLKALGKANLDSPSGEGEGEELYYYGVGMDCHCLDPFLEADESPWINFGYRELSIPAQGVSCMIQESAYHFLSYGSFSYFSKPCGYGGTNECYWNDGQARLDVVCLVCLLGIDPTVL